MVKNKGGKRHSRSVFALCVALSAVSIFSACAGKPALVKETSEITEAPEIIDVKEKPAVRPMAENSLYVPTPQQVFFNGQRQPIKYEYSGDDTPEIVYYPSIRARDEERGGSYSAPARVGIYYVTVKCQYESASAEFRIQKRPVLIRTAKIQQAVYNGDPKRVQVEVDPPVTLFYSYYPNQELMEMAINAEKQSSEANTARTLSQMLQSYRRVERAPTEPGTYYVWIYHPGDENYMAAEARVEFTILPAARKTTGTEPAP